MIAGLVLIGLTASHVQASDGYNFFSKEWRQSDRAFTDAMKIFGLKTLDNIDLKKLKNIYKNKSNELHPDKNTYEEDQDKKTEEFKKLLIAFTILKRKITSSDSMDNTRWKGLYKDLLKTAALSRLEQQLTSIKEEVKENVINVSLITMAEICEERVEELNAEQVYYLSYICFRYYRGKKGISDHMKRALYKHRKKIGELYLPKTDDYGKFVFLSYLVATDYPKDDDTKQIGSKNGSAPPKDDFKLLNPSEGVETKVCLS